MIFIRIPSKGSRHKATPRISSGCYAAHATSVRTEHAGASVFATNMNKNDKRHAWICGMACLCGWKKGGHAGPPLRYITLKSITIPAPTIHRHKIRPRRRLAQQCITRNPSISSGRTNDATSRNPPNRRGGPTWPPFFSPASPIPAQPPSDPAARTILRHGNR